MQLQKIGDWDKALRMTEPSVLGRAINEAMNPGITMLALSLVAKIKKKIKSGVPPKNHPLTIALKGSSKPLVGKGADLMSSVTHSHPMPGITFVGIRRQAVDDSGQVVADIAKIQERGLVLDVTPAMRGWFMAQGFPLKKDTVAINIPARPFMGPVIRDNKTLIKKALISSAAKVWSKAEELA